MKKTIAYVSLSLVAVFISGSVSFAAPEGFEHVKGNSYSGGKSFNSGKFRQSLEKMKLKFKTRGHKIKLGR